MAYKLLKEDDKAFHIQHPDGTTFRVAKNSVSPSTAKMIQKFANGGEVEAPEAQFESAVPQAPSALSASFDPTAFDPGAPVQAPQTVTPETSILNPLPSTGGSFPGMMGSGPKVEGLAPVPMKADAPGVGESAGNNQADAIQSLLGKAQTASDQGPALPQAPGGGLDPFSQQLQNLNKMEQAYDHAQASQDRAAKQTAAVIQDTRNQLAEQDDVWRTSMARFQKQDDELYQQLASKEVDPNHFYSSRSTAQKISLGLGMALAAAGGGGSDVSNMLNRAIDRDIESQKMNMNKVENQLSINMRREGNLTSAMQITKAQMLTGMQLQAQQIAAANGSPTALLQHQQSKMTIEAMKMQLFQQAAMSHVEHQLSGPGMAQIPGVVEQNKDLRERLVRDPVTTRYFTAKTNDDAKELTTKFGAYAPLKETLKTIKGLGTATSLQDRAKAASAVESLPIQLNEFAGINRLSEADIGLMQKMVGDPRDLLDPAKSARTDQLMHFLDSKMESEKRSRIPGYQGPASISFTPASFGKK